jgi:hypothetical protein
VQDIVSNMKLTLGSRTEKVQCLCLLDGEGRLTAFEPQVLFLI